MGTTFSNDPDDREDMLAYLKDNVERLVRQAEHADRHSRASYFRLLEQRKNWLENEIRAEALLTDVPAAPLGISDNVYDLATLAPASDDSRAKTYQRLMDKIETAMGRLWDEMNDPNQDEES